MDWIIMDNREEFFSQIRTLCLCEENCDNKIILERICKANSLNASCRACVFYLLQKKHMNTIYKKITKCYSGYRLWV